MHLRLAFAMTTLAAAMTAQADETTSTAAAPSLSNLQMSVILDGVAYADDLQGGGAAFIGEAAGISHVHGHAGHDHGALEEGFNLREAEVVMSATVDNLFDAYTNLAFSVDGVEVEEAYFTTRALPAGWQFKGGKFLSAFGYGNSKHPHSWDFIDQNLAYAALIGEHGLNDIGGQLTWAPATDTWMQFGVEVLQGHEQEKFGSASLDLEEIAADIAAADGAGFLNPALVGPLPDATTLPDVSRRGAQIYTGFFKIAPDLGAASALQLGVNVALHKSQQEAHEELDALDNIEAIFYANGEATLLGLEAVYKRAATGRYGQGALRVQAEYLLLDKDMTVAYHTDPLEIGGALTGTQDGFYVQGSYGFAPRWDAGLRYDVTGLTNELTEGGVTASFADSSRISAALTFRASEYSFLRLQLANADITDASGLNENITQVMLQFDMSLGAHGAHAF